MDRVAEFRHRMSVRFTVTLVSNVARMGLSFIAGLLLAKGLKPAQYGNLSFLLSSFFYVSSLLDMGSSNAFYTFLSQSKRNSRFYIYYASWLALQASGILIVISFFMPRHWIQTLWVDQKLSWILLACIATFLSSPVWRMIECIGEARRETFLVQKTRLGIAVFHFLLIGILYVRHYVTVPVVLLLIILEYVSAAGWFALRFNWKEALKDPGVEKEPTLRSTISEFSVYCKPLVFTCGLSFLAVSFDRWLLQYYGGSVQQGFFSVGQDFSAVSLLAAASALNVFWKETAHFHHENQKEKLQTLFLKSTKVLFFVSAAISCFCISFSKEILSIFLGSSYGGARLSFALLLLFPIHQSLGQLNGTYFLATHQTFKTFMFTSVGLLVGAPLSYFLVASPLARIPGLGLGAIGLSVSQVAVNFLVVNLQGYTICRSQGQRWPFVQQLLTLVILLMLGFLSRTAASGAFSLNAWDYKFPMGIIFGGICYLGGLILLAHKAPSMTGIKIPWSLKTAYEAPS
jgi:O-antigen/teichoic acid export membrane protein